jgi:MFS family permease
LRTTFRALAIRNYRLFATGSLVSNVGTWMQRVAQDWLILVLTDSPAALGITTGLQFLPILLFSAYAGVVGDLFPKRRVIAVTQTAMGLTAAALGILAVTGAVQPWHVYVLAFVFGAGTAFDGPNRQAFVSEMVGPDHVSNAVALNSASFNLGRVVGPAVRPIAVCVTAMTLRLGNRSPTTPAYGENSRMGRNCSPVVMPNAAGLSVSTSTSQSCATRCIQVPTLDTMPPAANIR